MTGVLVREKHGPETEGRLSEVETKIETQRQRHRKRCRETERQSTVRFQGHPHREAGGRLLRSLPALVAS